MQRFLFIWSIAMVPFFVTGPVYNGEMISTKKIIPVEKTIYYNLSSNIIPIKMLQYGSSVKNVFINLHDDEFTSVEAAKKILEMYGGLLIEVENESRRNIRFRLGSYFYQVDPNRIFSRPGISKSLEELGQTSPKAEDEAELFGKRLLQLIPTDAECIISLHNNTDGIFTVHDYLPGNIRENDSEKVFISEEQDPDDFFLTTDHYLYRKLSGNGFNTILQDNKNCTDDGSLSVYAGKKNIRYINCETEHGKTVEYYKMLKTLMTLLTH